ncbi:MAG: DNA translocase FtsK, partial [Clostridia bacterium]
NLDRRPSLNDGDNSSQTFASKQDMASIPKNLPKAGETFEHAEMSAKINAIKQDGATNLQQSQFGKVDNTRQQQFGNDSANRQPQFGNDSASRQPQFGNNNGSQPQARKDTYPLSSFGETDRQREDKMRAGQGRGIGGYQADSAQVSQSKNNNLDNKNIDFNNRNNDYNNKNNALNNRTNNFNNSNNGNNRNNDFNNKNNGIGNSGNNFNNKDKQEERLTQVNIEQAISQVTPRTPYVAPPLSLLLPPEARSTSKEEIEHAKVAITNTLLNQFDIVSEVVDVLPGPTLTLYTLSVQLPKGKLLGSMTAYAGNLAKEIPAESVRIIAPIPGKNAVGIEVSNKYRTKVVLSETLMSPAFNLAKAPATFAVGKNTYGKDVVCNIKDMPHVLIAGATASGKSCCINSIIVSFLYKASPDDVRLILIDPKRMELSVYDGIPHLLLPEIIYDIDKAIRALNWCIAEMDRRKKYLGDLRYRNIDEYNADCAKQGYQKMPRIIIIVDELADLMDMGKKAVEDSLNRLARLARAVGIHLVLATQRPSVDVIPGTIKNNLPTRIAFKLTSAVDSGTMLGTNGAEDLLGNGDLLFMSSTSSSLERMQGAYVSNEEVQKVVDFVKENNSCFFDNNIQDEIFKEKEEAKPETKDRSTKKQSNMPSGIFDALSLGVELEGAPITISNMQRRLSFGWPKAAKIYDAMDNLGFLSQSEKDPRAKYVNISQAELDALIRENSDEDDGE